jgi:hypothetical protein
LRIQLFVEGVLANHYMIEPHCSANITTWLGGLEPIRMGSILGSAAAPSIQSHLAGFKVAIWDVVKIEHPRSQSQQ